MNVCLGLAILFCASEVRSKICQRLRLWEGRAVMWKLLLMISASHPHTRMEEQCAPNTVTVVERIRQEQLKGRRNSQVRSVHGEEARESLESLPSDCLETLACLLDTSSALALLRTSRSVYAKLAPCPHYWKHLVLNEGFERYSALKKNVPDGADERRSWSGEELHGVNLPAEATHWQRVFQRGVAMRRNLTQGRFELWRMFMTGPDHLPVKNMDSNTTFRELRSAHRGSPFLSQDRRVRINRYWNEEFLVVLQHDTQYQFNDIFVWGWRECQNPRFLYSKNLMSLYPTGLFPTSFFLHKTYLVLMPDTAGISSSTTFTSMIRVHDLSSDLALVGSYSLPEDGPARRVKAAHGASEAGHLHRMGDRAVALCRTPSLTLYVFSLPDCQLQLTLPLHSRPGLGVLDLDDMDQRYLVRDSKMMFFFHHREFFSHLFTPEEVDLIQERPGRLLQVDFADYIKSGGQLDIRMDPDFDTNTDYIEKVQLIKNNRMVCGLASGRILKREVAPSTKTGLLATKEVLEIPCPEPLLDEWDDEHDEEVETEGPTVCCNKSGSLIVAMRHFVSGRKVHAYSGTGQLLYCLDLDTVELRLEPRPGYLSLDMDGQFLCVADQGKVVVWESATGRYVRTIQLPGHYSVRPDKYEEQDRFCWKGHTDFAFTEDGIIIIHSQRNAPVAADIFLFW